MISYSDSIEGVTPGRLTGFFVGWQVSPSPDKHLKLLANSDHIVLALDDVTGHVVGFVTAISDGVLAACIPLLEVLPAYQGQGIGSGLVRRMLARLGELYAVDLICDPDLRPFYSRFGMKPYGAMVIRNYERQSGA